MRLIVLTLVLALAGCEGRSPAIKVSDAWARATAPGQSNAAVYVTIANRGGADRLVGVSSDAGAAILHQSENGGGVARMRMVSETPIPAGGRVMLAPGGTHIMLTGLGSPLAVGADFPVTFRFAKAGPRTVTVAVVGAGAR